MENEPERSKIMEIYIYTEIMEINQETSPGNEQKNGNQMKFK